MITKMLTINTVHLSRETLEMLADDAVLEEAGAHNGKNFPFVKVHIFGHPNVGGPNYLIDTDRAKLKKALESNEHMPKDLNRVLREAFVEWCDTIRMTDDAPTYINLPKYDCN